MSKQKYIAIEGNIGAGKTSLSQKLAADWNFRLVLEQFTDNPFLPLFYKNPERYSFQVELFFMTERYKQLQAHFAKGDLFKQNTIADYFFIKTLLFAKQNLLKEEQRLFQQLFQTMQMHIPKPDVLVYLHRPIAELEQNIQQRGRSMEQEISKQYLQKVQKAYFEYFKTEKRLPILLLDVTGVNFLKEPAHYEHISSLIKNSPLENKVHYIKVGKNAEL